VKNAYFLFALFLIAITGCKKDKLTTDINSIQLGNAAGSVTFEIKSNIAWTIDVDVDWLSANPSSGVNDALISLGYTENKAYTTREAVVTINGGKNLQTLQVTQDAANGFQINWEQKADMPTARSFAATNACVIDGDIYIIGGVGLNGEVLDAVEAYNPVSDIWSSKASLLKARWGHTADVVDGKIYVMGGSHSTLGEASADMEVYDPGTDSWNSVGIMPSARIGFGSCVVNGKIYVMGGRIAEPGGHLLTTMDRYDPSANQWTPLQSMPIKKAYFSVTAIDRTIYAISGMLNGGAGAATDSVIIYDIDRDSWSSGSNLHQGRWGIVTCRADSLILCVGGYIGPTSTGQKTVEIIYTNSDVILESSEMIFAKSLSSICSYNGKIYVFGGANATPAIYGASSNVEAGSIFQ